jgi:tetratricopeptide (TPR) repeat protein
MKAPSNDVDKHGFPIPKKFDDDPAVKIRASKAVRQRARWAALILLLGILGAVLTETGIVADSRRMVGAWFLRQAGQCEQAGDLEGTLRWVDWAVPCLHDIPEIYSERAELRLQAKDLAGSLADFNTYLERAPADVNGYIRRSVVHQRLNDHRAAIEDLNLAVRLAPKNPQTLNARAYGRALAKVELHEALHDINEAMALIGKRREPAYLDTRGYIRFLLDDYKPALEDLNEAIEVCAHERQKSLEQLDRHDVPERIMLSRAKHWDEYLSVMYHHRGQVHEKLGHAEEAAADLKHGDQLGYNPAEGVY